MSLLRGRVFGATECGRNEQVSAEDTPSVCVVIEKNTIVLIRRWGILEFKREI